MSKHGWKYKKLGEVCETSSGGTPSKNHREYYDNGNIPWLRSGEVSQTYISETELFITQLGLENSSAKIFPIDTVVIAMYGATIGQVGILKNAMCTNQAICGIFPNSYFKPDFLLHILKSKKAFFLKQAVGGAQSNISQNIIKNLKIPMPPMVEQEAIVAELDEINEAIAEMQQQVADLDTLAQSSFYDMFGDPVTNPKGWSLKKLNESVDEMFLGPFGSALKVSCYVPKNESFAMVYEQKHAIQGKLNLNNHFIDKEKFDSLARFEVRPKDFIMSCRGTIGRIYQLPDNAPKGIIHPSLMKIRIKNDVYDYSFFVHLLQKVIAEQTTKGNCVQMAITAKELGIMDFILPPLALQQEFAARVEAIEAAKAELNAQIAEMQTLLASRMDYYFD